MRHNGFELHSGVLDTQMQAALVAEVLKAVEAAPFYEPRTPWGKPMSARQTSLGPLGWITDANGYRYEPHHPLTGEPWPKMPESLAALWRRYADPDHPPDSCLVNLYRGDAKMGLHQDSDEAFLDAPVLGISLGDTAVFRLGGTARKDPTLHRQTPLRRHQRARRRIKARLPRRGSHPPRLVAARARRRPHQPDDAARAGVNHQPMTGAPPARTGNPNQDRQP